MSSGSLRRDEGAKNEQENCQSNERGKEETRAEDIHRISSGAFAYEINKRTGAINGTLHENEAFLGACADSYALLVGYTNVLAASDETPDRVVTARTDVEGVGPNN